MVFILPEIQRQHAFHRIKLNVFHATVMQLVLIHTNAMIKVNVLVRAHGLGLNVKVEIALTKDGQSGDHVRMKTRISVI